MLILYIPVRGAASSSVSSNRIPCSEIPDLCTVSRIAYRDICHVRCNIERHISTMKSAERLAAGGEGLEAKEAEGEHGKGGGEMHFWLL